MPTIPDALRSPAHRPPFRRLAIVVGIWVALTAGALLIANSLDSPVGEGARDKAQPSAPAVPGAQAGTGAAALAPDAGTANLPPFAMVLDRNLPADIAGLEPSQQAEQLRIRAMATRDPDTFVELGSVLQRLGDRASAQFSYQSALRFDPENLGAKVGLAMVAGSSSGDGLVTVGTQLRQLATANPRSQLVSFNQAWLEIYRGRGQPARAALQRTVDLGAGTRVGRTAAALLDATARAQADPTP